MNGICRITKEYIRFSFVLVITIGIFIFLFHKIPFPDVLNSIKKADFEIILLTLGISVINNILVSTQRWRIILKHLGCSLSLKELLLVKMGSNPVVSMLPMKTGEFSRVLYLKRLRNISYPVSTFSIISEYLLNILAFLFFIFIGIIIYLSQNNNFNLSTSIGIMALCPLSFLSAKRNLYRKSQSKFYNSYYKLFKTYLMEFKGVLKNKYLLLYTFLYTFVELINVYLLSKAVYNPLPVYGILIFIPLIILISNLPLTVAGLGIREAAIIIFFLKFGPPEILLSLGILFSFVENLFPMIIGASLTGPFLSRVIWGKKETRQI